MNEQHNTTQRYVLVHEGTANEVEAGDELRGSSSGVQWTFERIHTQPGRKGQTPCLSVRRLGRKSTVASASFPVRWLKVDREHKHAVGARLATADDPTRAVARVDALTWRIEERPASMALAVPTYTLSDLADPHGMPVEDVLCTADLVAPNEERTDEEMREQFNDLSEADFYTAAAVVEAADEDKEAESAWVAAGRDEEQLHEVARAARALRVPMTHTTKDEEYVGVLAYRVEQELSVARERIAELEKLRDHPLLREACAKVRHEAASRRQRRLQEPCTCDYEDDGDGESGPHLVWTPVEDCPQHGRAAKPEEWAEADRIELDYLLATVHSTLAAMHPDTMSWEERHEAARRLMGKLNPAVLVQLYDAAQVQYEDGVEDDGHDGDRAAWDVAMALVAATQGRGDLLVQLVQLYVERKAERS